MYHRRRNVHSRVAVGSRIEEEITVLEKRLAQLGPEGDCAYEKAMIRFFQQQLVTRRKQLRLSSDSAIGTFHRL